MRLFTDGDYKQRSPSFSSDGRKFAYVAIDVSGNVKIAVADVTGITGTATPVITTACIIALLDYWWLGEFCLYHSPNCFMDASKSG